jgi:hypothetical protein
MIYDKVVHHGFQNDMIVGRLKETNHLNLFSLIMNYYIIMDETMYVLILFSNCKIFEALTGTHVPV